MNGILDRLFHRTRQRQESTVASYSELLGAVAAGEDVPDKRVDSIVEESGKSPDEFAADVQRLVRRRELAAIVQRESEYHEAKRQLRLDRARLGEEWKAANVEFNRRRIELGTREEKLNSEWQRISASKQELEQLAGSSALEPHRRAKQEAGYCLNESRQLRVRARELLTQAAQHERLATQRSYSVSPIQHDRLQAEREKNRAAELRTESESLTHEAAELEQRAAELDQEATRERQRLYELAN